MVSIERFFGTLIENYAGAFPFWLSSYPNKTLPSYKFNSFAYALKGKIKEAEDFR
jgi:threonyl-tRNA synthetase